MPRFAPLLTAPLLLGLLAGCGGGEPEGLVKIAVIPKGTTHEFWKSIHAGALKAAAGLSTPERPVRIVWKGPQKEDDREAQITVVESFLSARMAGLVLAPLDDQALVRPVEAAMDRGVPVVIIDSGIATERIVSFVATDNRKGGELGARRLAEVLGGKGRVFMLRYQEGSASTRQREEGFLAEIARHPGIEVVSADQYGGATTESAYHKAEGLLQRFPGIDGVFCPNESTTFGTLRALQDGGRAGKVRFVGFDASEKLVQALARGEIQGLVLQNPFVMGELGVRTLVDHLEGRPVARVVDTGVRVATPDNRQDPEVKALLAPDLARWLERE